MGLTVTGSGVLIRLAREDELESAGLVRAHDPDRVRVVSQAFVEFTRGDGAERWVGREHYGAAVSATEDATLELLTIAPRRIELAPELRDRLDPLERG